MKTQIRQPLHLLVTVVLVLALVATSSPLLGPPSASAQERVYYNPVSTIAHALYGSSCTSEPLFQTRVDWFGRQAGADEIFATAVAGPVHGAATLSLPDVAVALADASGDLGQFGCRGSSGTILTGMATIYDPQGRSSIKLRARFKAAGSSAPSTPSAYPAARWEVTISDRLYNEPWVEFNPDGSVFRVERPRIATPTLPTLLEVVGLTNTNGDPQVHSSYICDTFGCTDFDGLSTELNATIVFDASPGVVWIQLEAVADAEALAVVDPIIEPHPDNPDVVVTMTGPVGSGGAAPLAGITPEQLAARGLDPQPFINLGFFDPPAPSNHPPVAQCQNVSLPATLNSCALASASIDNASSDPDGDTLSLSQSPAGPYAVGNTEVTLTVSDGALSSQCTATVTVTDGQAPAITCPTDQSATASGSNGTVVNFSPIATDNCGTVMASCSPASGATFPLGTTPVTCTVTDGTGLQNSCGFNVTVNGSTSYSFTGFFQPVDNVPTYNTVKAGQAIPVKFNLGGNYGLNILAAGAPTSQPTACPNGGSVDDIEQVVTTSNSELQYDATTATYTYVWKTQKAWAGQCRQFTLTLTDGTSHTANFQFK